MLIKGQMLRLPCGWDPFIVCAHSCTGDSVPAWTLLCLTSPQHYFNSLLLCQEHLADAPQATQVPVHPPAPSPPLVGQ